MMIEQPQPAQAVGHRGALPGRRPPERLEGTIETIEPVAALADQPGMRAIEQSREMRLGVMDVDQANAFADPC
jgi:hypothetical protein